MTGSTSTEDRDHDKTPWRRRAIAVLRVLLIAYLALCLVARLTYTKLLFPAPSLAAPPPLEEAGRLLELPQTDGSHTAALYFPPPPEASPRRVVVMFHGNGQTMYGEIDHARVLRAHGYGVAIVEYRGYGLTYGSGAAPSEAMLYEDGEAVLAHLDREEHIGADRVVLWGWSLGSGVAAEMARRGHGSRLVLLSPFTSVVEIGKRMLPFLPVSLLMSHRFDTLSKAASIHMPTIVVHGDVDEVIPFEMGERVARAIPNAKLVRVTGGHHADLLYEEGLGTPHAQEVFDLILAHMK